MPSPDTFRRVFSWLDASALQERLARWVAGMFTVKRGQVVAWAGQTLPGSQDQRQSRRALHLVSAWASELHVAKFYGYLLCLSIPIYPPYLPGRPSGAQLAQ
jgi:hypothetical protein